MSKLEMTDMTRKLEMTDMTRKLEMTDMTRKLEMTDMTRKLEMTDMTRKLPAEMMERIFRLLPPRTLRMVVLVCRRWRELGEDPVLWCQLCLAVNERNLSFMSEMLSSRRLQEVRKLIIETPVTEEELQSVMRHPGLRELKIVERMLRIPEYLFTAVNEVSQLKSLDISWNDLSSVEPGLLTRAVTMLESLNVSEGLLTTQQTESILAAIREHTHKKKQLKSGHCPEGAGSGLAQIAWSTCLKFWAFLKKRGGGL